MSFSDQAPHLTPGQTLTTVGDALRALEAGAGTGGFYFNRKAADSAMVATTALVDDTDLQFPISANEVWEADFVLDMTGTNTTGDIKLAVNVPSGATGRLSTMGLGGSATTQTGSISASSTTDLTDTGIVGWDVMNALNTVGIARLIVVNGSTAGPVKLRRAQFTASGTTTLQANSYVKAIRVYPIQPAGANYGAMQLVQRQVLATPGTTFTFTGLDLNADETYYVRFGFINNTASGANVQLFYNGDTTATNYRTEVGSEAGGGAHTNDGVIAGVDTAANGGTSGRLEIWKPAASSQRVRAASKYVYGPFSTSMQVSDRGHQWTTTGANVTSLSFVASQNLAVDSFISLYRCAPVPMASDGFREVIAVSDQNVASNTTPANDAELFFTMEAAKMYEWEAKISYVSTAGGTTPDFKCNFNGPATLTGQRSILVFVSASDSLTSVIEQAALTATSALGTATTPRFFYARGWAYSTAGGIGSSGFVFQWSQNTSGANATIRLAGSMLRWRKFGS